MRHSLFWLLDHYPETGESAASLYETALEQAAEADRLGFTSLWLAEHHFQALSIAPNPAVLLAAIAQRTKTLRLGPATAVLPLRNAIHVAEDYALVDILSGGRLNMGVGSGSQEAEFAPFNVDFDRRKDLYSENLTSIRKRWRAAASGEIGTSSLNVSPVQKPTPPIYVATMNEDAAYQIGLSGDSLLTLLPPPAEGLEEVVTRVRAHSRGLEEAGHANGTAESVVMVFAHVAETAAEAKATATPALSRVLRAMGAGELPDPEAFYEQMRQNNVGLFGTRTEVGRQIERFTELGVDHLAFVTRFGGMSREASGRSLQMLAPGELPVEGLDSSEELQSAP